MPRTSESIYRNAFDVDLAFAHLERDQTIATENKVVIRQFASTWLAKGFTKSRAVKLVCCLRKLARILGKPFATATKDELIALIGRLETEKLSDNTKYDHKVILKTFYRWFKGDDEQYPKEVSWIKPRMKNRRHKLPEEMLTEDDVLKMAQAATHPRDKALILVLYESGCRIGELLTLKVKHVSFDEYGAVLRVTGKTGDRRVRVISAAPALTSWLEHYEGRNNPESYLWPARASNYHQTNFPAVYVSILMRIRQIAEKAGITKKVYPHLFRHSRATALANKLTEAQMKEHFGWTQSSDMASIYVHLSGRDVDQALLKLQGLSKPEEAREEKMRVAACRRCKEPNSPGTTYCKRCGTPINESFITEDYGQPTSELMTELYKDPEVKAYLAQKVVEKGLI